MKFFSAGQKYLLQFVTFIYSCFLSFSFGEVINSTEVPATTDTLSCSFDIDLCGWKQDEQCLSEWKPQKHSDQGSILGHTIGQGSFIAILPESYEGERSARLVSPQIESKPGQTNCLSFLLSLNPSSSESVLGIFVIPNNGDAELRWVLTSESLFSQTAIYAGWVFASLNLEEPSDFQIIIEGLVTDGNSSMAIEDLKWETSQCKDSPQCPLRPCTDPSERCYESFNAGRMCLNCLLLEGNNTLLPACYNTSSHQEDQDERSMENSANVPTESIEATEVGLNHDVDGDFFANLRSRLRLKCEMVNTTDGMRPAKCEPPVAEKKRNYEATIYVGEIIAYLFGAVLAASVLACIIGKHVAKRKREKEKLDNVSSINFEMY